MQNHNHSKLAVLIVSRGRPDDLHETLVSVRSQTLQPGQIILSVTAEKDVPEQVRRWPEVTVCVGPAGKCSQFNRGLKHLDPDIEVVAILDDDVELERNYLKEVRAAFAADDELVGLNGYMLVNGGIGREDARRVIADDEAGNRAGEPLPSSLIYHAPKHGLYGCCMSLRRRVFDHIQFDERLVLYSWMEDADIGIRAQKYGRCATHYGARQVHLGVQKSRDSGVKFGFSQIMNPVYLASTGVFLWKDVLRKHVLMGFLANLRGALLGDRLVDRWGRLRGNFTAFWFIVRGRIEPEHILVIER